MRTFEFLSSNDQFRILLSKYDVRAILRDDEHWYLVSELSAAKGESSRVFLNFHFGVKGFFTSWRDLSEEECIDLGLDPEDLHLVVTHSVACSYLAQGASPIAKEICSLQADALWPYVEPLIKSKSNSIPPMPF